MRADVSGLLKNNYMIIVKLVGGLGNQLFQYAAGLAIARTHNQTLKLDITGYVHTDNHTSDTLRTYDLDVFNITAPIATQTEIDAVKNPFGIFSKICRVSRKKLLRQYYMDYHPKLFISSKRDLYLDGFFQSEKNFIDIRDTIITECTLKTIHQDSAMTALMNTVANTNSVSLHIRRGDVANNPTTNKYHGLCPLSYYANALQHMSQSVTSPHVYIFSDDIAWVKENLQIPFPHTYVSGNNLIPAQEMYLMSKCKHNIIANSTFSWWGAWLNQNPDKIVIAPKKWTNKIPDPHPNIIPETWIRM